MFEERLLVEISVPVSSSLFVSMSKLFLIGFIWTKLSGLEGTDGELLFLSAGLEWSRTPGLTASFSSAWVLNSIDSLKKLSSPNASLVSTSPVIKI